MVLPGMSDGRCMTTYISSCKLNNDLMKSQNVNNNEYRRFLQQHAKSLMENTTNICKSSVNSECSYCIDMGTQK